MISINDNVYKISHSKISDIYLKFNLNNLTDNFDLEINRNDISRHIYTSNNSADHFFKSYLFIANSITLIKNNNGFFIKFNYDNFPNPEFQLEIIELPDEIFRNVIINQIISNKNKSIVKKQSIHKENIFAYLPYDIIVLIISIYNEPILLLTNTNLSKFTSNYKDLFLKIALQRELNNASIPVTFPPSPNHKFKLHQRIIAPGSIKDRPHGARNQFNCKIIEIKSKLAKYVRVDLYGNKIDDKVYVMEKVRLSAKGNNWQWVDSNKHPIRLGLLFCDYGPQITSIDSHYLKYKFALDKYGMKPNINVLVLIQYGKEYDPRFAFQAHATEHEYVICELDARYMRLECLEKDNKELDPYLLAHKIDNKWVVVSNNLYKITKIGCHLNGFSC